MTVRDLLSSCKNVDYGFTKVTVYDRNGGKCVSTPGDLPEQVKKLHVLEDAIGKLDNKRITRVTIWIEENYLL